MNVCPVRTAAAPADAVWALLSDPTRYDPWWNAETVRIVGQHITLRASAVGRSWTSELQVTRIDPAVRVIELDGRFPCGIRMHNRISVVALDADHARVQFG